MPDTKKRDYYCLMCHCLVILGDPDYPDVWPYCDACFEANYGVGTAEDFAF